MRIATVVAGMMFGMLFMWWGVVPTIDPAMKLLNAPWFFVSHLAFGMVLGLGLAAAQRISQQQQPSTA